MHLNEHNIEHRNDKLYISTGPVALMNFDVLQYTTDNELMNST